MSRKIRINLAKFSINVSRLQLINTKNIEEAHKILINMYESLLSTDPVKLYIKNNCDHLLSLKFSTDVFTSDKILTEYKDYNIKSSDRKNHPSTYTNKSGVYIFTCADTGFQYVG